MAQKWLVPYRRNRKNYEDIGLLPLALEHDVGFSGDKLYHVVKQSPTGSLYFTSTRLPLFRKRVEAIKAAKELAREGNPASVKSKGHLFFTNDGYEWYEQAGEIYRAPLSAVIDVRTKNRIGRWEFSEGHLEFAKKHRIYPFDGSIVSGQEGNPALSASQYGMAQAVLSGASKAMPKKVARELVEGTPARERSEFAKELAGRRENPAVKWEKYEQLGLTYYWAKVGDYTIRVTPIRKTWGGQYTREISHYDVSIDHTVVGKSTQLAKAKQMAVQAVRGGSGKKENPGYEYYSTYDSLGEAREKAKQLSASANVYTKIVKQGDRNYEVWTITKPRKRAGKREKNVGPPAWFSDSMSLAEFSEQFRRRSSLKFSNEQLRETWNDWKLAARRRREREESLERFYAREGNPSPSFDSAAALSTSFHGREPEEIEEIIESEEYRTDLTHLGDLVELTLITPDGKYEQTIEFEYQNGDEVSLASSPEGNQYYFEGGDQHIDLEEMDWLSDEERKKDKVLLGPVLRIAYYADKHHLEGGKKQKDGCEYEHEFGEETGNLPELIYDRLNEKLELVGGSYKTEDVGIRD